MLDLEHHWPRLARRGEIGLFDFAADHQVGDAARIGLTPLNDIDQPAVAQHGDAIGQTKYFVHLVRNVEHRHAACPQPCDDAKQPRDFGLGQSAGRFVHDQHVGFQRQRFGDLDQLLIADAQRAHELLWIDLAFELAQQLGGAGVHGWLIEPAPGGAQLAAEKNVGGGR